MQKFKIRQRQKYLDINFKENNKAVLSYKWYGKAYYLNDIKVNKSIFAIKSALRRKKIIEEIERRI